MNANQYTGALPVADRLWDKVEVGHPLGCWEWTAYKDNGYGRINVDRVPVPSHRVAYELLVGPIPDGMHLDHLCRNPSCVNPDHLEPVSSRDNVLRGYGWAGRHARKTHCPKGHPYTPENTYMNPRTSGERPSRRCRECMRAAARKYHARKRGAA